MISVHDVTHVRRLETIRRDFVANVSHELRTPISIVQASAEALQDGAIDQPQYATMFLDAILRNAERLNLLVQDILKLSRIEAGQNILDLEPVSVAEVVSDVIQILYTRSTERNHVIISTVDVGEMVIADAGSLEQILVNLLDNAMKYTADGANVRVSTIAFHEARVRILVADNEPGIQSRAPPASVRALLPGRCRTLPQRRGHRTRAGHRQAPCRVDGRLGGHGVQHAHRIHLLGRAAWHAEE